MAISEKIQQIIDHRQGRGQFKGKGHLQIVERKIAFFETLRQVIMDYQAFRENAIAQISGQRGDYYTMSVEDPMFEQKITSATPDTVLNKINEALKELQELKYRFARETINISVIGRARQGKSRLLQSISGLRDEVIPASNGSDCTGAKSVICNMPNQQTYAKILFYNEMEMVEQIQKYLDGVGIDRRLGSFSQIPNLLSEIERIDNQFDTLSGKQKSWFIHLRKYVEHFSDYAHYVGQEIIEHDENNIRTCVAQYGVDMVPTYQFLCVKEVQIYTSFPCSDAGKIVLVDTIGLGDTSIGIREKMLSTLRHDSDAAILVRLPAASGDHIDEQDNELYDLITEAMGKEVLNKWLFYALNVCDELGNHNSGNAMLASLKAQKLQYALTNVVNCGDREDVEENLLIPVLEYLSGNLAAVDANKMAALDLVLTDCYNEFYSLSGKIQALTDSCFKKDLNTGGLFDTLYEDELGLARKLEEYNMKYKNHDMICEEIDIQVKKSIANIVSVCPKYETIVSALKSGKLGAHPSIVYENMCDHYRADISDIFDEINRSTIINLQEGLKNDLIHIIRSTDGGMLNAVPVNTDTDVPTEAEWMSAFISQRLSDFPLVQAAFENVLNYRLNIEGMLEYYVNMSLEYLDPEEKQKFASIDFRDATNKEEEADLIEQGLLSAARLSANTLVELIKDLLKIPYNSFYARTRKLREAIIYSKEGERELKNMYREYATHIWRDRFAAVATKQVAMKEMNDIIDSMAQYRTKKLFVLSNVN